MRVMRPGRKFQLARIKGVSVSVGISWFFVLFFFIFAVTEPFEELLESRTTAYMVAVASVLSFFVSIVMHELGHAFVARRNGLTVAGIELWAFGGITRTTESPSPGVEFRVSAAGPAVTLLVIVACVVAGRVVAGNSKFFEVAVARRGVHATPALVWLSWLATINALMLVINLIPAFPLDGGRIARAAIWRVTGDRNRATKATGRAGQVVALALGAAGFWLLSMGQGAALLTIVLSFILYQSATAAVAQSVISKRIALVKVADIMDREPVTVPADLTLLEVHDQFFARYRWPWFAVVDPARHFLGVVRAATVDAEISAGRPALPVIDALEPNMPVRISEQEPLEALLSSEGLGRLGAMVAVDADGVLRGVVTLAQVQQALRAT
jgi:Zn-dependent protease